jgi:hypothetical protein
MAQIRNVSRLAQRQIGPGRVRIVVEALPPNHPGIGPCIQQRIGKSVSLTGSVFCWRNSSLSRTAGRSKQHCNGENASYTLQRHSAKSPGAIVKKPEPAFANCMEERAHSKASILSEKHSTNDLCANASVTQRLSLFRLAGQQNSFFDDLQCVVTEYDSPGSE